MSERMQYPYLPEGKEVLYVPGTNAFMAAAKEYALADSQDRPHPTGAVVVRGREIIGKGANYHGSEGCERKKQGIPTGQRYDLCKWCGYENHSERRAVEDARAQSNDTDGADVYMWGHWWCCESCWDSIIKAGIKNVYLLEDSKELFG